MQPSDEIQPGNKYVIYEAIALVNSDFYMECTKFI